MMITTKKFKLAPKDLFLILIMRYGKKRWWIFVLMWAMAIYYGLQEQIDSFGMFIIAFSIIYPAFLFIQLWRYVVSTDNKLLLLERHYEIDSEKITGILDEDTYSPVKLEHFIKVELIRKTYLLYIAKSSFIYIPVDSFENESDREWFENEIVEKIKYNV